MLLFEFMIYQEVELLFHVGQGSVRLNSFLSLNKANHHLKNYILCLLVLCLNNIKICLII